jgi:type I restriction enzyme S subunit
VTGVGSDGPLPSGWRRARLGDLCHLKYGKGLPDRHRVSGAVPVFGSNGQVGRHSSAITTAPVVVVGRKGSVGELHFSNEPCWPIDTTYYIDEFNAISPRWLFYLLQSKRLATLREGNAVPGLNRDDVHSLGVLLPPVAEQERIAGRLDAALRPQGSARAAAVDALENIGQLETAAMNALLRPSLSVEPNEQPPKGWTWRLLSDIARLESGHTPSRRHPEWWGGAVPWIALPDIRELDGREASRTSEYINEEGLANSSARLLPKRWCCRGQRRSAS